MTRGGRAAVTVLVVVLTACGRGGDGPFVATYATVAGSGDQALLEGELDLDGECVSVVDATGEAFVPVFPRQAVSIDDDGLRWDGAVFEDGDRIALGGGFYDWPVPDRCDGTSFGVAPTS